VRFLLPHLVALVLGGALALALTACGSEDRGGLLSPGSAQALSDRLSEIQARVADGECTALGGDLSQLQGAVVNLPASVDAKLRARLEDGVANLAQIAPPECLGTTVETTTPTETETTHTDTIPTTTTPTTAEPTPTPTAEPTVEPTPTPTPAATPTPETGGVSPDPTAVVTP